ncbi:MAG: hypothetical protein ACREGB_05700 [Candidatus Saccharimonadales bacterium]
MKKLNQSGFAAIEILLVLILLAILGFTGFYVYNAQHNSDKSLNAANKAASKIATVKKPTANGKDGPGLGDSQQYLTIKEWGIRAPYSGSLHLTYKIESLGGEAGDPQVYAAAFTSTELGDSQACEAGGGTIERASADTVLDEAGTTGATASKFYPVKQIGSYYYVYRHPQAQCSDDSATNQQTATEVSALVANLQTY